MRTRQSLVAWAVGSVIAWLATAHCADPALLSNPTRSVAAAVAVDPTWVAAAAPRTARTEHSATLLGDGKILFVGGAASPKSTEIWDPWTERSEDGPTTSAPRTGHTATMLLSGKVLIVGGTGEKSAELYDPTTKTLAPTGALVAPRAKHVAVRLRSGKVLVVGRSGTDDVTAEIYDPATGTFSAAASRAFAKGSGALTRLPSGKALFVDDAGQAPHAEIYDPDEDKWAPVALAPLAAGAPRTATLLRDGNVLLTAGDCVDTGALVCTTRTQVFTPTSGAFAMGPAFTEGRQRPSAALLPSGSVVFAGGAPNLAVTSVERFDAVGPTKLVEDGATAVAHADATATVLPGGDVVVVGGAVVASRRVAIGVIRPTATPMTRAREYHASVRLHDGRALVTGGGLGTAPGTPAPAEIYDPATDAFTGVGEMTSARAGHTATALRSGKVLLAGGFDGGFALASTEIYDPAAPSGSQFKATGALARARGHHVATLLPSGKVLLTGGCQKKVDLAATCAPSDLIDTAQVFDPATEMLEAPLTMPAALEGHGAVLLGAGKVLVIGGKSAILYDPSTGTFIATASLPTSRDGGTAHLLPNGKVLVTGVSTGAEIYDPTAGTWTSISGGGVAAERIVSAVRPDGKIVGLGGNVATPSSVNAVPFIFDPAGEGGGAFFTLPGDQRRRGATATLLGSGEVLVVGGNRCLADCVEPPQASAVLHGDGSSKANRPKITSTPSLVTPGMRVTLNGTGFANGVDATDGTTRASATNHPLLTWVSDLSDAHVVMPVVEFTDTSATVLVPATAHYGHGQVFVSVAGVIGQGAGVEIEAAPAASACSGDAQCASGFCADGVCCDRRCDGACEACSAAKRGSGTDGTCSAIAPGRGTCGLGPGTPPDAAVPPATADGGVGVCDGDRTITRAGAPSIDCLPYKCEAAGCKSGCTSVRDCASPFVCSAGGQCVAPPAAPPFDDAIVGCRAATGTRIPSGASRSAGLGLGLVVAFAVRRRRIRR